MRRKVSLFSILFVFIILSFSISVADKPLMIIDITASEAYTLINERKESSDFIILDVRTEAEYLDGHIENARNIDYRSDYFLDKIDELSRDDAYLIYCRSGGRSGEALEIMKELGFREVYHFFEGFMKWQEEGLPVSK